MEEGAMYNNVSGNTGKFQVGPFSTGFSGTGAWTSPNATALANAGAHASSVVISPLLCPSSGGGSSVETTVSGSSAGLSYASEYNGLANISSVAVTNYKAMAGTHMAPAATVDTTANAIVPNPNGAIQFQPDQPAAVATLLTASRSGIAAGGISDGMSKTVMIAETKERGYSSWIDGSGCWVVAYDPNLAIPNLVNGAWSTTASPTLTPITRCALSVQPALPSTRFLPPAQFGSRVAIGMAFGPSSDHQGGIVLHAYGDTHVSQITSDIDPNIYMAISSRNNGEAVSETP
jgi:hypothetical protein